MRTFFIILMIHPILSFSLNVNAELQKAEDAYKQKHYAKAIELYENLIHNNYYSSELYYNLGNAYYKTNQLGKAILYYEKAKLINPSDEDINHNLKLAYSKTIDKIETKSNFFIEITRTNFLNNIDTDVMAYITIVLSLLALGSFALVMFIDKYKKVFLLLTVLMVVVNAALYLLSGAAQKSQNTHNFAIITVRETRVFNEPIPNAVAKFNLHEGTKVKLLKKLDTFYLIRLENGIEGWIDEKGVEEI